MSAPILNQKLVFSGDASTAGTLTNVAYLPIQQPGQGYSANSVEYTFYVLFGAGTSAGQVTIETSPVPDDTTNKWAAVGSPIAWTAASKYEYMSVTGVFAAVRFRITTTVTGGVATPYVIAAAES